MSQAAAIREWVRFHDGLAADIHPDRWQVVGIAPEAVRRLLTVERARRTLSRHPECLAPDWEFAWNPWDAVDVGCAEWALWPGEKIRRAGVFFAMGCLRGEVARLVRRDDVARLKDAFGEDAYFFALRRAALVWPGDWPEAAGGDAGDALEDRVAVAAGRGIGCWLASLPEGLASRVRLKLPPTLDSLTGTPETWNGEARKTCLTRLAGLNKTVAGL